MRAWLRNLVRTIRARISRRRLTPDYSQINVALSFTRGFVVHEQTLALPNTTLVADWKRIDVSGVTVRTSPTTNVAVRQFAGRAAVLIGDAFVCRGTSTLAETLDALAQADDWNALDNLSGRFALLLLSSEGGKVAHDAFGSRSVFYRTDSPLCIASHAALLGSLFLDPYDLEMNDLIAMPDFTRRRTRYLPGDATMYSAIKALAPNNYLDRATGRTHRYWPRAAIAATTMPEFLSACDSYFTQIAAWLRDNYEPVLGISGGTDARAVVAALHAKEVPLQLVTWTGHWLASWERPVVAEMVQYLALPHRYIGPVEIETDAVRQVLGATPAASGFVRTPERLTTEMLPMAGEARVFVRGYGGEILRGFYQKAGSKRPQVSVGAMNRMYLRDLKKPHRQFAGIVGKLNRGFFSRANYDANLFGVDVRDLYYWEQRMGMWGAMMLASMDPAIYALVGINSRPLYELALGLPEEDRLDPKLLLKITAIYDQALADMGKDARSASA